MRPSLVIRLSSDPGKPLQWVRLDAEARVEGAVGLGDAPEAAAEAQGRRVIVLAPGTEVLLLRARIPTQSRQRQARAVPYAVEDQLAGDVDTMHFALGNRNEAGELAVAVVGKSRLQYWLDQLREAGLEPDQIHPDVLALPWRENTWTVLADEQTFLVRTGPQDGFSGDTENLELLLGAALGDAGEDTPETIEFHAVPGIQPPHDIETPLAAHTLDTEPVAFLASNLDESRSLPLLSGRYGKATSYRALWMPWRATAALLAGWMILTLGQALAQQWAYGRQLDHLHQQVEQVYRQTFPGENRVVDARSQMESRLNRLKRGSADQAQGMLEYLERIGPSFAAGGKFSLTGMTYRGGVLEVELQADSLQSLDQLKQELANKKGIKVEVRSAKSEGDKVQSHLMIRSESS